MKSKEIYIIDFKFLPHNLIVHWGAEGLRQFETFVKFAKGQENWSHDEGFDGLQCENRIWVDELSNRISLYHEAAHFLEWFFDDLNIEDESEFKAHITGYLFSELEHL